MPSRRSTVLEAEASAYAALEHLQGKVILTLYRFYEIWGIHHTLALEPVGDATGEDEKIDEVLREKMRDALRCVHSAGFVHDGIACRSFCSISSGFKWRVVMLLRIWVSWAMR